MSRNKTSPRESLLAYLVEHRADLTGPAFESYLLSFGAACRAEGEQEVYDEGTEMRAYAGEAPSPALDGLASKIAEPVGNWTPENAARYADLVADGRAHDLEVKRGPRNGTDS